MNVRHFITRSTLFAGMVVIVALMFSSCNLQKASPESVPSTPTMELDVPIIEAQSEADSSDTDDTAAPEAEADAEVESEEAVVEEETEEASAPTETPKPQPTATEKPSESENSAAVEEEADVEPTPTEIPYVTTSNSDPMVLIYGQTNCYQSADSDSKVIGVASGGTALGAYDRQWNWYEVVHPTIGGLTCWVTGEYIRPNQTAFKLGD